MVRSSKKEKKVLMYITGTHAEKLRTALEHRKNETETVEDYFNVLHCLCLMKRVIFDTDKEISAFMKGFLSYGENMGEVMSEKRYHELKKVSNDQLKTKRSKWAEEMSKKSQIK